MKTLGTTFRKYPVFSNSIIYGSLCVGAEFSQQTFQRKLMTSHPEKYDTGVIARYAIYGTTMTGPLLTVWYRWLDNYLVGKSLKVIAGKVLIDQFFMTPQILVIFYVAMSIMERKENIFQELQEKFPVTFKNSCLFWLPMTSINFLMIPKRFRVIFVGSCSFAWINILCWIKRNEPLE